MQENRPHEEKKILFEKFLTYRRRMARLCAVQAAYLFDINNLVANRSSIAQSLLSSSGAKMTREEVDAHIVPDLVDNVLYFYKNIFFIADDYDAEKKGKRIEEKYFQDITGDVVYNIERIDKIICEHINEKWTIDSLDFLIRAILRCGIAEVLFNDKTDTPILTSEYTNLASNFFAGKQIGFVNGVIDKIAKIHRK